jgi:hypothetical protein
LRLRGGDLLQRFRKDRADATHAPAGAQGFLVDRDNNRLGGRGFDRGHLRHQVVSVVIDAGG